MAKNKKNNNNNEYMTEFAEEYGNTNTSFNNKTAKKQNQKPSK